MDNIKTYLQASYEELTTNVTWPTWKELQANAAVVAVASVIIALIIGLMDMFSNIVFSDIIYNMAKQPAFRMVQQMSEDKKWYVLRVISGKEKKLRDIIEKEIKLSGWADIIPQVIVPTEKVYKLKGGKKVIHEKNFFPGYLMMEADPKKFNGDIVLHIQNMTNVISFIERNKPIPLKKAEVNRILGKVDEQEEVGGTTSEPFLVGEDVKITDGPFNDFTGTIEEIMEDKKKLRVVVKIFGRKTPVELNFMQVEKQ